MDEERTGLTVFYLDTSAIMRLLTQEGNITAIEHALCRRPTTADLTRLELQSAIHQRWRQGIESGQERDMLLQSVARQIEPVLTYLPLIEDVVHSAIQVVSDYSVRSLDAIHLATAIVAARHTRRHGASLRFCTADRWQMAAAEGIFGKSHVDFVHPPG